MCPLGIFLPGVVPSVVGIVRVITAAGTTLGTASVPLVIWAHPVPVATSILAMRVVCAWAEATSSLGSREGEATVATELPRRGLLVLWLWRLLCDGLALLYGICWQKYLCIPVYSVAYHSVVVFNGTSVVAGEWVACNYTVHACFICVCVLFSWLVNITHNTSSVLFHSILTYLLSERWMSFSPFSWMRLYLTCSVVRGWCFLRIFLKPYMFDPRANDYTI